MESSLALKSLAAQLLNGLDEPQRVSVLSAGTLRRFPAASVVTNQGRTADHLFLLAKGRARFFLITEDGEKLILSWLAPGEIFGVRSLLFVPSTYLVSTETVKESVVIVWNRSTIRNLVERFPRLLDNAILEASDFVASQMASYVAVTSHSARQRLLHVLTALAPRIGRAVTDGIELDVTNDELASAANVSLFTASRFLSGLERKGVLLKRRGKVLLRSPERLLSHAA